MLLLPGLEVLTKSEILTSTPEVVKFMLLIFIRDKDWVLYAEPKASNIVIFIDSFSRLSVLLSPHSLNRVNTLSTSQVVLYLGAGGLSKILL